MSHAFALAPMVAPLGDNTDPNEKVVAWIDWKALMRIVGSDMVSTSDDDKRRNELLQQLVKRGQGGSRFVKAPSLNAVHALHQRFPHFVEVIDHVLGELALLASPGARPRRLTPLLLLGNPGIGKTRFVHDLAAALAVPFTVVPMNTATGGFLLSGLDRSWSGAKPGMVFDMLMNHRCVNPVVLLDELEKAQHDGKYDPLAPMYQLLETSTARRFVDEYVQVPVNAGLITWVATANTIDKLPPAIVSRLRLFEVNTPTPQQMRPVVDGLLQTLRHDAPALSHDVPSEALDRLCQLTPRAAASALSMAAGRAALRARLARQGLIELRVCDFEAGAPPRSRMGFY